jgi:DNA-binding CsgD family transcriptional regulator
MKNKFSDNSLFFVRDLLRLGLNLEAIAKGSRLSLDLIHAIDSNQRKVLDENQFNLLLGFYCYHLCQTQSSLQSMPSLSRDQTASFAASFLNHLHHKPWLTRKVLVLVNNHGKENPLTMREQELLYYLLKGKTQIQAASALKISLRTVHYHWQRMRDRFKISTVEQLIQSWQIKGY